MPEGLDIDHKKPLTGTVPRYARHVVIRTGRDDWSSRIEDEESSVQALQGSEQEEGPGKTGVNFAKAVKALVGPRGKYHDVCTDQDCLAFVESQCPYVGSRVANCYAE